MVFNMELTKKQKALLENKIYNLIKESFNENDFFENGYFENSFPENNFMEKEHEHKHEDDNTEEDSEKRLLVMKWLDSEQDKHSVLSYKLWPDKDKDQARSDFSKNWRGEDGTEHKKYSFTPEEINRLYNLRNDYIKRGSLNKK